MDERWGIDLGGTKVEGAVLADGADDPSGCLLRLRIDSEADQGYEHLLSRILVLIERIEQELGRMRPQRIGFGTPGSCDPETRLMRNCNSTALNGRPLQGDLEQLLGVRVLIENDANCFTLAEARWGAAKGRSNAFCVILGTGVGGGIVFDGRIVRGLHGIAGEWGHNPLVSGTDAAPCYCGKSGCVETVLSGPALERFYTEHAEQTLPLARIAQRDADSVDPVATRTIDRLCMGFGQAIATVVNILDPEAIVVGGGVSNVARLFRDAPGVAARSVFHDRFSTPILPPKLGDSAGVFGAAMLDPGDR
ncbi:MAG TPA: ROK family protein [Fimbriimonadaceae bacterium]|nr:ROK family protein [Fimbriimonadaceae bacterium]HRJ95713.1 ROK family protein [Fimbriimonadaceae bacterium]